MAICGFSQEYKKNDFAKMSAKVNCSFSIRVSRESETRRGSERGNTLTPRSEESV